MRYIVPFILLFISSGCFAQQADSIDFYVTAVMKKESVPGSSLLVIKDGKIIKATSYGLANLEHKVPAKFETVFELASVSKPITALAIMQLVEQGKISLDSSIANYIDGVPASHRSIKVRHLLTHTSGLPELHLNFTKLYAVSLLKYTVQDQLADLYSQKLLFPPGEGQQYSNGGFFLLSVIIARVSGMPFEKYMQKNIFDRAMMKNTRFISADSIVLNRAQTYTKRNGTTVRWSLEILQALESNGFGGLLSTTGDLAQLYLAMIDGKIVQPKTLELMMKPEVYKNMKNSENGSGVGLGWFLNDVNGKKCIQHTGHTGTVAVISPSEKFVLVYLSNLSLGFATAGDKGYDVKELGLGLAARFLK
jgi:CubicO group peptidase (beta-lactamase class C family)